MGYYPFAANTALTNPMTAPGDLIDGGTAGTPQRLPVGSNTEVLTVVAGAPAWAAGGGGGGSGTVTSVAATDTSIVVSGTPTVAPTIATGTLDVIAAQHPPAAAWSNNSFQIHHCAFGSAGDDVAAVGQILPAAGGAMTGNLELVAGTTSLAPLTFQSGTNLTAAAAGDAEFDGTCFYATAAAASRQVLDAEQFTCLSAPYTLANNTSAQPLLNATTNGALTVQASTMYFFECIFNLTSLSGSSHSIAFSLGGTASFTSLMYEWIGGGGNPSTGLDMNASATATATTVVAAGTTAACNVVIRGSMRVNAGGTVIPQVTQVTASAAAVVAAGSYFRAWPAGSGAVTNVGDWS